MNHLPKPSRLYSKQAVSGGAFIFAPLAIYFFFHNFKALGSRKAAYASLIIGILVFIIGLAIASMFSNVPRYIIPAGFLGIALGAYQQFLDPLLKRTESPVFYTWQAAVSIIAGALLAVVLWFGLVYFFARQENIDFTDAVRLSIDGSSMQRSIEKYEAMREKIVQNDTTALDQLKALQSFSQTESKDVIATSLQRYQENLRTLREFQSSSELPKAYTDELQKLISYTNLRIQQLALMQRAEIEQTETYDSQIEDLTRQINALAQ